MKEYLTVVCLLLLAGTVTSQFLPEGQLILITAEGTLNTRIMCMETVDCTGVGTDVFWTFFGLGTPIPNSENRFTNSTILASLEGESVIRTTLTLSPVQPFHQTLYQCQVVGSTPFSSSLTVIVDLDPLEIVSQIPNIDLSNEVVGDNLTVACQVETCVSTVTINLFKGNAILMSSFVSGNTMDFVSIAFNLPVNADTAGQYACQGVAEEGSTAKSFFNITGSPIVPTTSEPPVAMTTTTTAVSQSLGPSSSISVSYASILSTRQMGGATSDIPIPTMSPSTSPGGGSASVVIEWTLLLSLLLITLITAGLLA